MAKKYKVDYKYQVITGNETVNSEGASVMTFIRQGVDTALIQGAIQLNDSNPSHELVNREFVAINQNFSIQFDNSDPDKNIVVEKAIYTLIN